MIAWIALGCTGREPPDDRVVIDDQADSDADADADADADTDVDTFASTADTSTTPTDTEPPPELHGDVPPVALPPPVFSVLAMDSTERTQADLIGHPTVMWFYPAAFTGG
jgi:hypothetical protein